MTMDSILAAVVIVIAVFGSLAVAALGLVVMVMILWSMGRDGFDR